MGKPKKRIFVENAKKEGVHFGEPAVEQARSYIRRAASDMHFVRDMSFGRDMHFVRDMSFGRDMRFARCIFKILFFLGKVLDFGAKIW